MDSLKKKNPMYNARKNQHDLVILEIQIDLNQPGIYVTDKNASVKVEPVKFFDCEYITKDSRDISKELFEQGLCLPSGSNLSISDQNRVIKIILSTIRS